MLVIAYLTGTWARRVRYPNIEISSMSSRLFYINICVILYSCDLIILVIVIVFRFIFESYTDH